MKEWMNDENHKSREDRIFDAACDHVIWVLCLGIAGMVVWTLVAMMCGYWIRGG